jgi:uroporphyrinogen decarboxylase
MDNRFNHMRREANASGRRLVAPLAGLPGLSLTGGTVKLAGQNAREHFRAVRALADRLQPDLAFTFMDLSVEANALGRQTVFPVNDSPTVVHEPFSVADLERLERIDIAFDARLQAHVDTVRLMRAALPDEMLRGAYVAGPYTLAGLLMGADDAAMATIAEPEDLHAVCRFTARRIEQAAGLLVSAGAEVICILDPSAVMLGPDQFSDFSVDYVRGISASCRRAGAAVLYHVCGNTTPLFERMAEAGVDALSLDSEAVGVDLAAAAAALPDDVAVLGNINPTGALLNGTPAEVEAEVCDLVRRMGSDSRFVLSTGCDLPRETPLENLDAFMRAGRDPAAA